MRAAHPTRIRGPVPPSGAEFGAGMKTAPLGFHERIDHFLRRSASARINIQALSF